LNSPINQNNLQQQNFPQNQSPLQQNPNMIIQQQTQQQNLLQQPTQQNKLNMTDLINKFIDKGLSAGKSSQDNISVTPTKQNPSWSNDFSSFREIFINL
jgi:hypothetical protein